MDDKLCEMGIYPSTLGGLKVHVHHGPDFKPITDSGVYTMSPHTSQTVSDHDYSTTPRRSLQNRLGSKRNSDPDARPHARSRSHDPISTNDTTSSDVSMIPDDIISASFMTPRLSSIPPEPHEMRLDLTSLSCADSLKSDRTNSMRSIPSSKFSPSWHGGTSLPTPFDHSSPKRSSSTLMDESSSRYRGKQPSWKSISSVSSNKASPREWKRPKLKSTLAPYTETVIINTPLSCLWFYIIQCGFDSVSLLCFTKTIFQ